MQTGQSKSDRLLVPHPYPESPMKQRIVNPTSGNPSRRIFLRNSGLFLAVLGTGALLPAGKAHADDDGMLTQASVHYDWCERYSA